MKPSGGVSDKEEFAKLLEEMDWLEEPEEGVYTSQWDSIRHKIKKNPLVPLGCLATITVLGLGFTNFVRGGPKRSQNLMRWRVGLQGSTIGALVLGILYDRYSHYKK